MKKLSYILILSAVSFLLLSAANAQDTTKSLAFKNNRPPRYIPYFYRPDLGYQIWQQFKLIQKANEGDPLAQHELGLRYLLGEGMPADTSKAVYWIKKAADQKLPSAMYNYGILLYNGWGTEWDPFTAFKYFKEAAKAGMVQAQYIVGILYTDNLLTKRDYNHAYYWLKKSANGEYEPAKEVIDKVKPEVDYAVIDSLDKEYASNENHDFFEEPDKDSESETDITSPIGLDFIDFNQRRDTIQTVTDSMLIANLQYAVPDTIREKMKIDSLRHLFELTDNNLTKIKELAENGSPEAQAILGRMYEKGINFKQDLIKAAAYYFRALRTDSPTASFMLWQMSKSSRFLSEVQRAAENQDPEAKFVWYGLTSINLDYRITITDAIALLQQAAESKYLPAMTELGLNYYTGRFLAEDKQRGLQIWKQAAALGSSDAKVRLLSAYVYEPDESFDAADVYKQLEEAAVNGSLLAQVTLAYCSENGIGTKPSKGTAVNYYRSAAQRGSQYALRELQRLYDEVRPNEPEFMIN